MALIHQNSTHTAMAKYRTDSYYLAWGSMNIDRITFPGVTGISVRSWNLDANGNGEIVLWLSATDSIATELAGQFGEDPTGDYLQHYPLVLTNDQADVGYAWIVNAWANTGLPLQDHQVELHFQITGFSDTTNFVFRRGSYGDVLSPVIADFYIGTMSNRTDSDSTIQVTISASTIPLDEILYHEMPVLQEFQFNIISNMFMGALYDGEGILLRPANHLISGTVNNFVIQDEIVTGSVLFPEVYTNVDKPISFYVDALSIVSQNEAQMVLRRAVI